MPKKTELKCYFGCVVDGPLHRFPKWVYPHEERFNSWKAVLNFVTQNMNNEYIYNNIRLCYRHFEDCYQLPSHRLTGNAIPTLNCSTNPQNQPEVHVVSEELPSTSLQTTRLRNTTEQNVKKQSCHYHKTALATNKYKKQVHLLRKQLLTLRNKCKTQATRIRMAEKISKLKNIMKYLEELPEPARIFTVLQLRHLKTKPRGRNYTLKEKILSLTIFKQSPKAYNLLEKLFTLPSKRTLQKLLNLFIIKPGINFHIMNNLKKSVARLPLEKRLCSLIFDEVSLSPGLFYNKSLKEIVGFEDFGYKKTSILADHALVLMVKSIKGKFKQPLCFTFCRSATKKEDLKIILTQAVKDVSKTGLKIICTICDQSTTNISTINSLIHETKEEYLRKGVEFKSSAFEINDNKIFCIYDPPHLLKGMRNNLLVKNLRYIENDVVKVAKWEHIKLFIEKDVEEDELKLVKKLTEAHVNKEKIPKMKVKYAAQVFSQQLAAAMKFCTRHNILPKVCDDTADLLLKMDQLFDSFNGHSYNDQSKRYRVCLKNNSPHFLLWNDMLPILRSMGFETRRKDGTVSFQKVPSITNFIKNICTYKEMWQYLHKEFKVTSLLTRNLNQDPLENFFCKIRNSGVRNVNPTCNQFISAYKTLMINNMATPHSVNANCEDDDTSLLQSYEYLLTETICTELQDGTCQGLLPINVLVEDLASASSDESRDSFIDSEKKNYVAGYIIKKAKIKIFKSCPVCNDCIVSNEKNLLSYTYHRDYTKQALIYPTKEFKKIVNDLLYIISKSLQESPESRLLLEKIRFNIDIFCTFDKIQSCTEHGTAIKQFVITLSINIILHSWCSGVNKILKGRLVTFNEADAIKRQAYKYYKDHLKYKNK